MILPKIEEKRNVLPNWRQYDLTARLGEFSSSIINSSTLSLFPIDSYIYDWKDNRTLPHAADLICAAILNNQTNNLEVIKAAKFIVDNQDYVSNLMLKTANSILETPVEHYRKEYSNISNKIENISLQEDIIRKKISILKKTKDNFCNNPIAYCELSRYYVILGQLNKAKTAIETAIHLAPNHRFISRSAARFFLHIKEPERARYILSHNKYLNYDPWLLASEIAINTLMGRNSRNIKKGKELILSEKYSSFSLSELSSAIGTQEINQGNLKSCKKFFNLALSDPNDNTLAQAKFLKSRHSDLNFDFKEVNSIQNAFEAQAISFYDQNDFMNSLIAAVNWIEDMPFTKRPVFYAANLAYSFIKDYELAIKIINIGLKSNPYNVILMNNKAYVCALTGNFMEAENLINAAKRLTSDLEIQTCLTATEGLIEYRKGNNLRGKELYTQSIHKASHELKDEELKNMAILNHTREEIIFNKNFDQTQINTIQQIPNINKEVIQLKMDINAEINKIQSYTS